MNTSLLSGKPAGSSRRLAVFRAWMAAGAVVGLLSRLSADRVVSSGAASGEVLQVGDAAKVKTVGTVEVADGAKAYFRSGTQIVLQPGFKSTQGSFFQAAIAQAFAIPLAWQSAAGATSYRIYRNGVLIAEVSGAAFLDTGVTAGGTFVYVIKAVSGSTETTTATFQAGTAPSLEVFTPVAQ